MNLWKETVALIRKDFMIEWRQRHALNGILLYVLMVIFIIFLSFGGISIGVEIWNTLFWIVLLFSAVNGIAKSFIQESRNRDIYYFTIASPRAVIFAKMLYNILLMLLLAAAGLAFYTLILGFPVQHPWLFGLITLMGAIAFSISFTMIAGISSKANNSTALMAILSFPIFLPMLIVLLSLSKLAIVGFETLHLLKNMVILLAIDGVVIALSMILFPYIWRD